MTTDTNDLFNTKSTSQTVSIDPDKDYFEELVGDDKPFKSPKDLARAKLESDKFIEQLKQENREWEKKAKEAIALEIY